jgi:integrase
VDWSINQRGECGQSVIRRLCAIKAALRHPKYAHLVGPWLSKLIGGIDPESEDELKEKQAAKQVPYDIVETIPTIICAGRKPAARRGEKELAVVIRDQLLMLWLIILPWRRHNLAGCRIEGPHPNLFKAKIDPNAHVSKTSWVEEELKENPEAEFWQCKFSGKETKAGNAVHILLPRPLIPLLEEYLHHRKNLLGEAESNTLFLNTEGTAMSEGTLTNLVSELTLRHIGKAVSPHTFRHIVAYGWLKDHPGDFLTVSKLLFHKNLQTTINCYASRFNESDGACGMERWFESRHKLAA